MNVCTQQEEEGGEREECDLWRRGPPWVETQGPGRSFAAVARSQNPGRSLGNWLYSQKYHGTSMLQMLGKDRRLFSTSSRCEASSLKLEIDTQMPKRQAVRHIY